MLHARSEDAAYATLTISAVLARLDGLNPGALLTLVGLDTATLRTAVEADAGMARQILELDLDRAQTADQAVGRILEDLAALALALWPSWYGGGSDTNEVLAPWRRAAARLASSGRAPRFRRTPPRIELQQLLAAIDPAGLVLTTAIDPSRPHACATHIAALEWCASAGASVVILSPSRPPPRPPFDRVLYDAIEVTRPPEPVLARLIVPPKGKAHGSSDTEKRIREAILRDDELAPLFDYNRCIPTKAPGFAPRVDLVWGEGRIVVELDGREHQGDPNFADDRHRDYELLLAGYLVLRLTNAQVVTDLQLAIEKIRRVVHYRRSEGGFS